MCKKEQMLISGFSKFKTNSLINYILLHAGAVEIYMCAIVVCHSTGISLIDSIRNIINNIESHSKSNVNIGMKQDIYQENDCIIIMNTALNY